MIHLTYNPEKDKWILDINAPGSAWKEISDFLRLINVYYTKGEGHTFTGSDVFTMLIWFRRYNWTYSIELESVKHIEENKWFADSNPVRRRITDYSRIGPNKAMSGKQKLDVLKLLGRDKMCNFNDAGLGKTIEAIHWFITLYLRKEVDSAIITVPSGLSYQWIYEFIEWTDLFTEDDFGMIENDTKIKPFGQFKDKKILLIPDHLLAACFASYRKEYTRSAVLSNWRWKEYVNISEEWGKKSIAFIGDEFHRFANMDSLKTIALDKHIHYFKYRLLQTATPAITRFEDYYVYLYFTDKSLINMSKEAFTLMLAKETGLSLYQKKLKDNKNLFDTPKLKDSKYAVKTYNEDAVAAYKEIIAKVSIQRLKKDDPDMKFKLIKRPVYFKMTLLHEKIYEAVADYYLQRAEISGEVIKLKDINNKFPYLIQVLENPELLKGNIINAEVERLLAKWTPAYDERLLFLDTFLDEHIGRQQEKVIVFDHRPKTLDMLYKRYEKKYKPLMDHGKVDRGQSKEEYFKEIMTKFNDPSSDCQLLLLSELTASAGLNLQKGGNRIVYYTVSSAAVSSRQGQDRQTRFSSTRDSFIYYLLFKNTLDERNHARIMGQIELNDDYLSKELSASDLRKIFRGMGK